MSLKGKTVLIFGGSAGMGAATAKLLLEDDAKVIALGRDEERLGKLKAELPKVRTMKCNIMRDEDVAAVLASVDEVDHVVVTAATIKRGRIMDTDMDSLMYAFHERLGSVFRIVKAAVPKMKRGSFVFCSGTGAIKPVAGAGTASAAALALEHLTHTLALELAPIRANTIRPGLIMTDLVKQAGGANWQQMVEKITQALPGKTPGTAAQAADAIRFLLLNEYMNGEVITIDGGLRYT